MVEFISSPLFSSPSSPQLSATWEAMAWFLLWVWVQASQPDS